MDVIDDLTDIAEGYVRKLLTGASEANPVGQVGTSCSPPATGHSPRSRFGLRQPSPAASATKGRPFLEIVGDRQTAAAENAE